MGVIRYLLMECLEKTSAKGVPRIIQHKRFGLKAMWFVGVMLLTAMALYTLVGLIEQYLTYTTTTMSSEEDIILSGLPPPDLVVCNMQAISMREMNNISDIIHYTQYLDMIRDNFSTESMRILNRSNDDHFIDELRYRLPSHEGFYQFLVLKNATKVGHQLDTLVVDFRWLYATTASTIRNKKYDMKKVQRISTPRFYNCYRVPMLDSSYSKLPGVPIGLSLMLYMDKQTPQWDEEFSPEYDIPQGGGIRLTLNNPGFMQDLMRTAFDVWYAYH